MLQPTAGLSTQPAPSPTAILPSLGIGFWLELLESQMHLTHTNTRLKLSLHIQIGHRHIPSFVCLSTFCPFSPLPFPFLSFESSLIRRPRRRLSIPEPDETAVWAILLQKRRCQSHAIEVLPRSVGRARALVSSRSESRKAIYAHIRTYIHPSQIYRLQVVLSAFI